MKFRILCFAFERTISTVLWSWYEKGSLSTLIVRIFILFIVIYEVQIWISVEGLNVSMYALHTYLKCESAGILAIFHNTLTDWVSLDAMFIHNLLIALVGFVVSIYFRTFRIIVFSGFGLHTERIGGCWKG